MTSYRKKIKKKYLSNFLPSVLKKRRVRVSMIKRLKNKLNKKTK